MTKTASGTFDREYFWSIEKNANETLVKIAEGGSYTFEYTVDVYQTGSEHSCWVVHAVITISNPNDWQAITLTSLSDVVDNGGTCTLAAGPYVVAAGGSIPVNYSCSFAAAPSSNSGTNTATATWDAAAAFTPSGSNSGSAGFTLTKDQTTNETVNVTDSYAGALGSVIGRPTALRLRLPRSPMTAPSRVWRVPAPLTTTPLQSPRPSRQPRAGKVLGWTPRQVAYKMKKHGLASPWKG